MWGPIHKQGCYFQDRKRRVDYVIIPKGKQLTPLVTYIRNLESFGLQFEVVDGQTVDKKFILIHMPFKPLKHFSKVYQVGLQERKCNIELINPIWYTKLLTTPISRMPPKVKGEFTTAERIIIMNKLLESTAYDNDKKGISRLVKRNLVETAYPLHDGPIHSDPLKYTNDRQLLFHHWSIINAWYKELPLDMIYRYFGSEIAFYFAWLEFFNFMLVPPAIIGSVVVIINLLLVMFYPLNQINEVCTDYDMWICPTCEFGKYCTFKKLSSFCYFAEYNYVFDNYVTVAFAIFMSFWATYFIHGWRRQENKLKLRWDVQYQNPVLDARLEYNDSATSTKINKITGKAEPYIPKRIRYWKITLSVSVCLFMIFLVIVGICGIVLFKIFIKVTMDTGHILHFRNNSRIYFMMAGALVNVIFIKIFSKIYGKLSVWLTNLENPRTQHDYDKSYLYKKYLLSFANNYLGFFYDAFVKGRFYTLPDRYKYLTIIERDTCQPLNCIFVICMSMGFLLMLKQFAINVVAIMIPNCRSYYRKLRRHKHEEPTSEIPQYEADYKLLSTNRFFITANFSDMVISYGHVTFFVAAFPLAPLCVLLNNLLEVRKQADRLVTVYKRPVPKVMEGIGPWNGIMLGVTYLSTATNAFVIAFTSSFIERERYQANNDYDLKGYVNSTLSVFDTADYPIKLPEHETPNICYYKAKRHPPDHPMKYHLTRDYWCEVTWKLICVLIFEHVILVCNKLMEYLIPDIPKSVEEQLKLDRELAKEARDKYHGESLPKPTRKQTCAQTGPIAGFMQKKES